MHLIIFFLSKLDNNFRKSVMIFKSLTVCTIVFVNIFDIS